MPFIVSHQLRPILVAMPSRLPDLPDVPAAPEVGLAGFQVAALYGIVASRQLDPAIVQKLNRAIAAAVAQPAFTAALSQSGIIARETTVAEAATLFDGEIAKWSTVVSRAGIKIEGW
jgi:tripartite-type tricarboxylate transporter receptor subunit TctC